VHHVSLEDVVHDVAAREAGGVDEQLEGELEPRIHFAATSFPLAFLAPFLPKNTQNPLQLLHFLKSKIEKKV